MILISKGICNAELLVEEGLNVPFQSINSGFVPTAKLVIRPEIIPLVVNVPILAGGVYADISIVSLAPVFCLVILTFAPATILSSK